MTRKNARGVCSVDGCDRPHMARGWCSTHYSRWWKSEDHPRGRVSSKTRKLYRDDIDRFMGSVQKTQMGCWLWCGEEGKSGYGAFTSIWTWAAHRWSYEYHVGPIPEGLQLDHLCRVPRCVNPEHLEPVTSRENTMRGVGPSAINARKTRCPQGHPYNDANTYGNRGGRQCRVCNRLRMRKARAEGRWP